MKSIIHTKFAVHLIISLFLYMLSTATFASKTLAPECTNGSEPSFSDYTAPIYNKSTHAKLKINNEFSRMFITRLSNGLRQNPINFAGHYIVVTFGCGTGCLYGGYIDTETGQATELPFSVSQADFYRERDLIEYRADSRLFIVNGHLSEDDRVSKKYFFVVNKAKLVQICHAPPLTNASHGNGE